MKTIADSISRSGACSLTRRAILKSAAAGLALASLPLVEIQSARAAGGIVALVHTQAAGDSGPIDSMIANLKKSAAENGFEVRTIYAQDPASFETILRGLGNAGAAVVFATFLQMGEPIKAVAPDFPNTKFVQLYAEPMNPALSNVVTVSYGTHLACYLSGLFGAHFSASKKIAYMGGVSLPGLVANLNAVKLGASQADSSVTFSSAFAGSFQDPGKGQDVAGQIFKSGVDYIQTDAAATDLGVIKAAEEIAGSSVSGGSVDQFAVSPKTVVTAFVSDMGISLYDQMKRALAADWKGGHFEAGFEGGVIDFVLSEKFVAEGDPAVVARAKAAWPEVEKAKAAIIAGTLKVPFNPTI